MADIHSNYLVFKKAYEDAISKNVDSFIFLGDYVTDGFDANKIIDIIKNSKGYVINGNRETLFIDYSIHKHEKWDKYIECSSRKYGYECLSQNNLEYLKTLSIYKIIDINNKKICISHGTPNDVRGTVLPDSYLEFDKLIDEYSCDIYMFGHQHRQFYVNYKGKIFVNPGSIGLPTDGGPFKYGIINIGEDISYDDVIIEYEYKELERYYKDSDYYKNSKIWCELILMTIKDRYNHCGEYMKTIRRNAKNKNIDISYAIPDDLFSTSFEDYISNLK